jgi:hypothetical protein
MRRTIRALLAVTAGLLLAAGATVSPAAATRSATPAPHAHSTATPMPGMPGMDHGDGDGSRPRALVLGGFGGLNGAVLLTAMVLRRRAKGRHR